MAQCYRNSGSLKNGMVAQAHRTSGSFAPRLFSNTEAKESEEDYEWEVIYEDNCDKWDCAFKICFERKKKEVAKDN